ncbi:MAG TPA: hypothetical protein VFE78_00090 [Gemmataceae bacterium]|jgi:hypothetical protein|nr:hypothetical protein [Gemmataceae bacterium]
MDYSPSTALPRTTAPRLPAATRPVADDEAVGTAPDGTEEALVEDVRAGLTPSQMVERKLVSLLKSNPLPVSHLMAGARIVRAR